ncbi:MAG: elongation factor Ts [Candidatus Sericytochromatia bacterium]|nr:MAG: elongation factor Ts [Candidatus Sericytochromatia bacterium]
MEITASLVKELRERTGLGMMDCKKALSETNGDIDKAIELLRKKGALKAESKLDRKTSEGIIGSYIHMNGKIGVLVEVNCETDFVARNSDFQQLVKDLAMHIAAFKPAYVKKEDVPTDFIEKEKEILLAQPDLSNKPDNVKEKIISGRLDKILSEICLMDQPFVKNNDITVGQLIKEAIAKIGENITVKRFVRFALGE